VGVSSTASAINTAKNSLRSHASKTIGNDKGQDKLGKQDFLNLFMTQMSNQDPMSPMKNEQMMQQMSQLGMMEQLQGINGQMKQMNSKQGESSRFEALKFLGKDVSFENKTIQHEQGTKTPIAFNLEKGMKELTLQVVGKDNKPVFTHKMEKTEAGHHQFTWEGKNDQGRLVSDGKYTIKMNGVDKNGSAMFITPHRTERVTQVKFKNGKPWLQLKTTSIPVSKVASIDMKTQELFGQSMPLPLMKGMTPKNPMKK
jgi:flagellar basal-body rod modification protein FlgD